MTFRVPLLLNKSYAVIYRLNPAATEDVQPHAQATSGYDPVFKEPVVYDDTTDIDQIVRDTGRVEYPPIRVPCQVEIMTADMLRQFPAGNAPDTGIILVFHKADLTAMRLIDSYSGDLSINVNDRISRLESFSNPGRATYSFIDPGVYIYQIQPRSWGFGPDGFDLYLAFLNEREKAARA